MVINNQQDGIICRRHKEVNKMIEPFSKYPLRRQAEIDPAGAPSISSFFKVFLQKKTNRLKNKRDYGMISIYLLTAIGLSPGGSSTVHIYTQTIHRTIQNKQYIEQHNNLSGRVRAVPRLG